MATDIDPISLNGMFPGGFLREGRVIEATDGERIVCEPHVVTLTEVRGTLGGSPERDALLAHLVGFWSWFSRATSGDGDAELWVRGGLAASLAPMVSCLDLVAIHGPGLPPGDSWMLRSVLAGPVPLAPYSLDVTALRHDDPEHSFDRAREAVRSRVRVRNSDGDQVETGWLSLILQGGAH